MTVVVDTSVIVKWFHAENEAEVDESRAILAAHRDEILTAHILDLGIYEFGKDNPTIRSSGASIGLVLAADSFELVVLQSSRTLS